MSQAEEILQFWFQDATDDMIINKNEEPFKNWFSGGREFDEEIRSKFEQDYLKAKSGELDSWSESKEGALALILLFDQIPRNIYRNTPQAYETDDDALLISVSLITNGKDKNYSYLERLFIYMPLMHCEDIGQQYMSRQCFQDLVTENEENSTDNVEYYQYHLKYALSYYEQIERFFRFPHRNKILNRESTEAEIDFLTNQK